jgi:hypothetical protein
MGRGRIASRITVVLCIVLAAGCGQSGSEPDAPDADGKGSPDGSESGDASYDARANDAGLAVPDGAADVLQQGDSGGAPGSFRCGPEGGTCAPDGLCVESIFVNGLPGALGGGSDTFSCATNPCDGSTGDPCTCGICPSAACSAAGAQIMCTTEAVCASGDTPIATSDGERPIASIRPGDMVYSADDGALRLVPVVEVARTAVFHHRVIALRLSNGSELRMSAGHPLADGRHMGSLKAGDVLEGAIVLERGELPYDEPYTYDILPRSDSHAYVAAGVLVGTTLGP